MQDYLPLLIYLLLVILWVFAASYVASSTRVLAWRFRKRSFVHLQWSFAALAVILGLDSFYWGIATAARLGYLVGEAEAWFYSTIGVTLVKSLQVIGAILFFRALKVTFGHLQDRLDRVYFLQFAEQVEDAIGILDQDAKVVFWNEGAIKLFGFPRTLAEGRRIQDFLVPEDELEELEMRLRLIQLGEPSQRFLTCRNVLGKPPIEVDIRISRYELPSGSFGGFFGVMRRVGASDVEPGGVDTRSFEQLRQRLKELESQDQTKRPIWFGSERGPEERSLLRWLLAGVFAALGMVTLAASGRTLGAVPTLSLAFTIVASLARSAALFHKLRHQNGRPSDHTLRSNEVHEDEQNSG